MEIDTQKNDIELLRKLFNGEAVVSILVNRFLFLFITNFYSCLKSEENVRQCTTVTARNSRSRSCGKLFEI